MRRLLVMFILSLIFIACEKDSNILISDLVIQNQYYDNEIFTDQNLRIYGKWEFLYSFGGIGGSTYDPTYDFLEIVKFGIYGIIDNNNVREIGMLHVHKQDDSETIIDFLPDDEYKNDYFLIQKIIEFNGNDTLLLWDNMCDGYTDYFKRIN
jgi:hypothetical protein